MQIAARFIAVLALGAAMIVALMALRGDGTPSVSSQRSHRPGGDPFRAELQRCRDRGLAAVGDELCSKAWPENRRRFFKGEKNPSAEANEAERAGSPAAKAVSP
ncbi:putative entry exclusion protein TrbK-alt [Chelativorans sp.]|uniref:putative entry exclusion protein TrbK-alt n=1 Tax=Chelativorans sp. TaxID=2203393 RepID=UPI0028122713|nr:putative entry exclusion protein TrbK-alt [Chelativorans sp.]